MAIFSIFYKPADAKKNGQFPIYIRVRHNGKLSYINTQVYGSVATLDKKGNLPVKIARVVDKMMEAYENKYNEEYAFIAFNFTVKELVERLVTPDKNDYIDFYAYLESYIEKLHKSGREGSAKTFYTLLNSLRDYREWMYVHEITTARLNDYAGYLRKDRVIERKGNNAIVAYKQRSMSDLSINTYIKRIRTVFNEIRKEYADEDISFKDPFIRYDFSKIQEAEKRSLSVSELRTLIRHEAPKEDRLGKDMFLISIFFCGINLVDIYNNARIENGRLEYNRTKTRTRRIDDAFSSIEIQPEAEYLIRKYSDGEKFVMDEVYKRFASLQQIVNKSLGNISKALKLDPPITYYSARHTVASIMSNELEIPLEHIQMVLNHVDQSKNVVNGYIRKDFSKLDRANRKFLDLIFEKEKGISE